MDIQTGFFYLFAAVLLFSAFRVVTARNPVHAVLYLMLTFSQASGLWFMLNAEFLAITLVLVYLGAVMVLFLFVVMMLDINVDTLRAGFWKHFPLAATLGAVVAFEMATVLMSGFRLSQPPQVTDALAQTSNAKALGVLLYTDYLMPIQIAAAILLVAMVAAIALTLRQRKDSKAIDPSIQVRVKARDRVSLVKVAVTQTAPAPVVQEALAEEKKQ
ncbi:MAG: NADH-quinone oxidoreductase subunit J [Limnohabitans sp.]